MKFIHVENQATEIANLTFANLNQKKQIRDSILAIIVNSCASYASDEKFRDEVNRYRKYAINKSR